MISLENATVIHHRYYCLHKNYNVHIHHESQFCDASEENFVVLHVAKINCGLVFTTTNSFDEMNATYNGS